MKERKGTCKLNLVNGLGQRHRGSNDRDDADYRDQRKWM